MATIDLMDRFGNLGHGGIRNNGTLDAEVLFQPALRSMRTDFIQVKAGDSIVYKNMNGIASTWNILSFYTGEAQGYYVSGIAGQTTPQSGVWTAAQDGYIRLFGSFPAGDNISVMMTDLAPDVEDYLSQYNAMNYRFLPNSIPKIVAHIQEYLSDHPIADSTTLQAVIDAAFESYMEEIQETADTYISEAVPPAAAAAVDAAASPALAEITAKAAEAAESAREAALSEQSAEMSEENALSYRNQAQQIKDSISAEVAASVLAAQEQATLAQGSAQAADESADTAEQFVAQARAQAEAAADHAQTASGYASDAQGYMQDASGFAQNASDFADNAAQSAATFTTDPTLTIAGKAADAKATGDELSDLKKTLTSYSDSEIGCLVDGNLCLPSGFLVNGNISSAGNPTINNTSYKHRVFYSKPFIFSFPITLELPTGYVYKIFLYSAEEMSANTKTDSVVIDDTVENHVYNVPANQYFSLFINRYPTDTSDTFTPSDAEKLITIKNLIYNSHNRRGAFDKSFNYIAYSSVTGIGDAPVNTLEHLIHCCNPTYGFTTLKGDIRLTSDGKLIMCHDAGFTLNDEGYIVAYDSQNSIAIHDMTYAECVALQHNALYNGNRCNVIGFETFLKLCKQKGKNAFVTIRDEYLNDTIPVMLSAIYKYNLEDYTIINAYVATSDVCTAIRTVDKDILINWTLPYNNFTKENIDIANSLGNCQICNYDFGGSVRTGFTQMDTYKSAGLYDYALSKKIRIYEAILTPTELGMTSEEAIWKLLDYGISGAQIGRIVTS